MAGPPRSQPLHRRRALLAGFVLLLGSAQSTALAGAARPALALGQGRAGTCSTPPAGPAVPGRLRSEAVAQSSIGCDPLPPSALLERPGLPWIRSARTLDVRPIASRPADSHHRPAPARGPPRSHLG